MEMILDKKQIQAVFLFEFRMGHKAAEMLHKPAIVHLAQELLMNVQWRFKKCSKGDERLEDEERSGWPSKVDSSQLRAIIKSDPLTTAR